MERSFRANLYSGVLAPLYVLGGGTSNSIMRCDWVYVPLLHAQGQSRCCGGSAGCVTAETAYVLEAL